MHIHLHNTSTQGVSSAVQVVQLETYLGQEDPLGQQSCAKESTMILNYFLHNPFQVSQRRLWHQF